LAAACALLSAQGSDAATVNVIMSGDKSVRVAFGDLMSLQFNPETEELHQFSSRTMLNNCEKDKAGARRVSTTSAFSFDIDNDVLFGDLGREGGKADLDTTPDELDEVWDVDDGDIWFTGERRSHNKCDLAAVLRFAAISKTGNQNCQKSLAIKICANSDTLPPATESPVSSNEETLAPTYPGGHAPGEPSCSPVPDTGNNGTPTQFPTKAKTGAPTPKANTKAPSKPKETTKSPSKSPNKAPTRSPVKAGDTPSPTKQKTKTPSTLPTAANGETTNSPSKLPTRSPVKAGDTPVPTKATTKEPTTQAPSVKALTKRPTARPTTPTSQPSESPSWSPTAAGDTRGPSAAPTRSPTHLGQTRSPSSAPTKMGDTPKPTLAPTRVGETRAPVGSSGSGTPAPTDDDDGVFLPTDPPTPFIEESGNNSTGNGTDTSESGDVGGDEALYLGIAGGVAVVAGAAFFATKKARGSGAEYSYRNESHRAGSTGSVKTAKAVAVDDGNTITFSPSPDVEKLGVATYASSARMSGRRSGRAMSGRMSGRAMSGKMSAVSTMSSARSALSRATTAMTARSISSASVMSENPSFGREPSDFSSGSGSMMSSSIDEDDESRFDEDDVESSRESSMQEMSVGMSDSDDDDYASDSDGSSMV
jgi:hypothetical protein